MSRSSLDILETRAEELRVAAGTALITSADTSSSHVLKGTWLDIFVTNRG